MGLQVTSIMKATLMFVVAVAFTSCRPYEPVLKVTPTNETSLQQWQQFSSPDGSFTIEFPEAPFEDRYWIDTPAGRLEIHGQKFAGSAWYFVSYVDYPAPIDGPDAINRVLDSARDGGLKQVRGQLLSESVVSVDGHPGRLLVVDSLEGPQGSRIKNKIFVVGRRFYSVQVAVPKELGDSLNSASDKFIDSFKLNAKN